LKSRIKIIIAATVFILSILAMILVPIFREDIRQKQIYNDFVAVSNAKSLSVQKELDFYYLLMIENEKYYTEKTNLTKADLIFDYAGYGYVPVLNYLIAASDNPDLIADFQDYSEFIEGSIYWDDTDGWNGIIDLNGKEVILAGEIDKETVEVQIRKFLITKESTQSAFQDFLSENSLNSDKYFYLVLLSDESFQNQISSDIQDELGYSSNQVTEEIMISFLESHYDVYFSNFEELFVSSIADILSEFTAYLYSLELDQFEYECVVSSFIVRRNVKLENMPSRYYTYNWSVDVPDAVNKAKEQGIPFWLY